LMPGDGSQHRPDQNSLSRPPGSRYPYGPAPENAGRPARLSYFADPEHERIVQAAGLTESGRSPTAITCSGNRELPAFGGLLGTGGRLRELVGVSL
jgi:hypothetical protein